MLCLPGAQQWKGIIVILLVKHRPVEMKYLVSFPIYFDTHIWKTKPIADGIANVWPVHWFYILPWASIWCPLRYCATARRHCLSDHLTCLALFTTEFWRGYNSIVNKKIGLKLENHRCKSQTTYLYLPRAHAVFECHRSGREKEEKTTEHHILWLIRWQ